MKDHLNLRNPLTAVGEHCAHEHHNITVPMHWRHKIMQDSVQVLAREDNCVNGKVREAIKINLMKPTINQAYELPRSMTNRCYHVTTDDQQLASQKLAVKHDTDSER